MDTSLGQYVDLKMGQRARALAKSKKYFDKKDFELSAAYLSRAIAIQDIMMADIRIALTEQIDSLDKSE